MYKVGDRVKVIYPKAISNLSGTRIYKGLVGTVKGISGVDDSSFASVLLDKFPTITNGFYYYELAPLEKIGKGVHTCKWL